MTRWTKKTTNSGVDMTAPQSLRHKTARARTDLSRPVKLARELGVLSQGHSLFDYGCGYGSDVELLSSDGIQAVGWDPVHRPESEISKADVVNLGYVVNVIECADERGEVLRRRGS